MDDTTELNAWRSRLSALWPDCGALRVLNGEHDTNLADGQRVYKVAPATNETDVIDLQWQALQHVRAKSVPVPRPVATSSGEPLAYVDDSEQQRTVWAQEWIEATPLAKCSPCDGELLEALGGAISHLHDALEDFEHPALERDLRWRIESTPTLAERSKHLQQHPKRERIDQILSEHSGPALKRLAQLPTQALHYDLNDHNLLYRCKPGAKPTLAAIIDFGDMMRGARIIDLSIAATYLLPKSAHPLRSLRAFVGGYHQQSKLSLGELELLWPLMLTRMVSSMVIAWEDECRGNDDPYRQISQAAIHQFLEGALDMPSNEVLRHLAAACDLDDPDQATLDWIADPGLAPKSLFKASLANAPVLDLSITGAHATDNPVSPELSEVAQAVDALAPAGKPVLGRYREPRLIYGAPFYLSTTHGASERRTIHIALDVFLPEGTEVHAPYDATVLSAEVCDAEFDYGGLIVLAHEPIPGIRFYTLYGHLQHASARALAPGDSIKAGEAFARLGAPAENGGWPPHIHFQVSTTEAPGSEWPGVVDVNDLDYWIRRFPDPSRLAGLMDTRALSPITNEEALRKQRAAHAPGNLRLSYGDDPVTIVRGWRALLFDATGRTYLDAYNNVPHVGHTHPHVRASVDSQMRWVNTNTRYLQPIHSQYCEALLEHFPASLNRVFLVCSGSEANELAVRLARAATRATDMIALRAGYHGHTVTAIDLSDYKAGGPGGNGVPDWVHLIDNPDTFTGIHRDENAAERYAAQVDDVLDRLDERALAGFIAETFPSVGGQVVPPPGYLSGVYSRVRKAGGVCIADEVQTGLGRLGHYFWGFEHQAVTPDIVVLGKPMGNGYPLAAVVTTDAIATAFDNGMEFFATFGGSSVACAAGKAVLEVLREERLQENAAEVGTYLKSGLEQLATLYPVLSEVRGEGLFLGIVMVDAEGRPAAHLTRYIVQRMREQRVLIGSDGAHHNVLKIRPPLVFSEADADHLLSTLDAILQESALRSS
ncbi:MAG: aminotransferase class III-fold pyridoxal phosphate-dependent enzyme [Pseudomonadota bacterium]